ncbi:uncharacterized protein LOC131879752 isoform X1 [Tigriopus californicus]|uniref:uncharacterized protein LOC131879752 isoform X1 n=1 Tax=Tigriopus californicus TaxID=6832 RepID=UPI0027D9D386|nr:uncharacterized protein LOC131879752 isoform X1 [Tigriopus californicus]
MRRKGSNSSSLTGFHSSERTQVGQWKHVPGHLNPADLASRGTTITEFMDFKLWKEGPSFLSSKEETWPKSVDILDLDDDDLEIKKPPVIFATTKVEVNVVSALLESISDWNILLRTVVGLLKFQSKVRGKFSSPDLHVNDLYESEASIIRFEQAKNFGEEIKSLAKSPSLLKKSKLRGFSPFVDNNGILRVGGRLTRAENMTFDQRHPILLAKGHVSILLIRKTHDLVGHMGKTCVITKLREKYRIVGEGALVKTVLRACIHCRRYQGRVEEQIMADLPEDRVLGGEPPFTNTGVDLFGPFKATRGRALQDRYGLIFTCLASRAAHIEIVYDNSTDSFIQALRRFIARRGQVKRLRSDNGTNFTGAERELRVNLDQLNQGQIKNDMISRNIEWLFNPPYSHHFGGVWEREIRTIRKIMSGLMDGNERNLSYESLNTLMCEVEAILNSRPLTTLSDDPNDVTPLTPNHLLLQMIGPTQPPGIFPESDNYAKYRWRQVQHLADLFWRRWSKEYVSDLISRKKWSQKRRDVAVNDLVLLVVENSPRCQWPLCRIVETYPDSDGHVRVAKIKTAKNEYRRPIGQFVMLRRSKGNQL